MGKFRPEQVSPYSMMQQANRFKQRFAMRWQQKSRPRAAFLSGGGIEALGLNYWG
jgi:hypothetical protein